MNRKSFFTSLGATAAWLLFPFRKAAAITINPIQRFRGTKSQFVVTFVEEDGYVAAHMRDISNRNSFQQKTIKILMEPACSIRLPEMVEKGNMAKRRCLCNQMANILHQRVYPQDHSKAELLYKPGSFRVVEESQIINGQTYTYFRTDHNPHFTPIKPC